MALTRRPGAHRRYALALLLALMPVAACAHVSPQKQSPSPGADGPAPAKVTIVFDGPLEQAFTKLTVSDAGGKTVSTGQARIDPDDRRVLSVTLPAVPPGAYTVHWVAVSSDGHRTQGDYLFHVK